MAQRNTLELIGAVDSEKASHPVGTLIEVVYDIPALRRKITYLGYVAVRPEDKAKMSVVTNKYGCERILPVAATYTLNTISKDIYDYLETENGQIITQTTETSHLADLTFDPTNPAFLVTEVSESIPEPRIAS